MRKRPVCPFHILGVVSLQQAEHRTFIIMYIVHYIYNIMHTMHDDGRPHIAWPFMMIIIFYNVKPRDPGFIVGPEVHLKNYWLILHLRAGILIATGAS
jgi:hypothetical protein